MPERCDRAKLKRIFMVGCPRSGTTILQAILGRHPSIVTFPESHLFMRFARAPRRLARRNAFRTRANDYLHELGSSRRIGPFGFICLTASVHRNVLAAFDDAAIKSGKHCWIEKTPKHLHKILEISKVVPDAKFIHVVRQGADVSASLRSVTRKYPGAWGGERSLNECVERWNADAALTLKYAPRHGHSVVLYENMLSNPIELLQALLKRLDLENSEPLVRSLLSHDHAGHTIVRAGEEWKQESLGALQSGCDRLHHELTESERDYILRNIDESLYQAAMRHRVVW